MVNAMPTPPMMNRGVSEPLLGAAWKCSQPGSHGLSSITTTPKLTASPNIRVRAESRNRPMSSKRFWARMGSSNRDTALPMPASPRPAKRVKAMNAINRP